MSYFNRDTSAWEPLVDAKYRLVVSPGGTYTGQTNANGEFTFPCGSPGATGTLDVWYESAGKVSVIRHGTVGTLAFHGFIAVTLCGGYTSAAVDQSLNGNAAARMFTNALISVNTSRTLFPARAAITYKMSTKVPDTYYSTSDDHIQIDTLSTWGPYGIFAPAHEYGHALHHTALGGLKDNSGTCATHMVDGYYNYGCAYKEGFADYHAAVVRGSAGEFFTWTRDGIYHAGQNGATNEIGVSSFLYDLTDPAGDEVFDAAQYPTSYVADIYRTCNTHDYFASAWMRAHGIDHMVYCFERTVDPAATAYFRGSSYDGQAEAAIEPASWSQTAIRNIWLRNMFNQ